MATKTNIRASDPYRFNASNWKSKDQWRKWERVGMAPTLAFDDLILNWADKRVMDLAIKEAVESIQVDRTIEGANTVTITLRDPHQHIFSLAQGRARRRIDDPTEPRPIDESWQEIHQIDVIGRAIEIQLDECAFRLVKVGFNSENNQTTLTFEDRMIYWLRRKKGHSLRVSRNQVTRAQFILRLLRQVQVEKMPFICPELHQKQLIAKIAKDTSDDPDSKGGFDGKSKLTVKGVRATAEQRRNMATAFDAVDPIKGATDRVLEALACTCIDESLVKNLPGGDADSRGIIQVQDRTARGAHVNNRSISSSVIGWAKRGYGHTGGAIEYAKKHPHATPGEIAAATQYLASNAHLYQRYVAEARKWVRAWKGSASDSVQGNTSYVKSYQYARDKDENSWDAMQRLAEEVGWRAFIVGRSFYYMSEEQLYERRVRHIVRPDDGAAVSLQADMDWGKPYNEASLVVNLERWSAPPGSVIELADWGPPVNGRWLVFSSTRDWFSPLCTLTLRQPGGEKREPAPEIAQNSTSDAESGRAGGKSAEFYRYAQLLNKNAGAYLWGGGHGDISHASSNGRFDCSGAISFCAYHAGMWPASWGKVGHSSGNFESWGESGPGERITVCANGGHVFANFEEGMGVGNKRIDTGGGGNYPSGPRIKSPRRPPSGFVQRHWPGT